MMTIKEIAAVLKAHDIDSPFSTDWTNWSWVNKWQTEQRKALGLTDISKLKGDDFKVLGALRQKEPYEWHRTGLNPDDLPDGWESEVHDLLARERLAERQKVLDDKWFMFVTVECPFLPNSVKCWLLANRGDDYRMYEPPAFTDVRAMMSKVRNGDGVMPELDAKNAMYLGTRQNSYDDTSYYLIQTSAPVARDQLRKHLDDCRTATGFAGQGYTLDIEHLDDAFVVIRQRCSISD